MQLRPIHVAAAAAAAWALASTAALLRAGPLNPPAGPVSSTYKTLTEVEPRTAISDATTPGTATALYRISQPGSYYLTANIAGASGKRGIEIASSGVSVDLRGFSLTGVPGSLEGIGVSATTFQRLTIRNGTVTGWGGIGVDFSSTSEGCTLDQLHSVANASHGVRFGLGGVITDCLAQDNGGSGFALGDGCALSSCTAQGNAAAGFTGNFCSLLGCAARGNTGSGFSIGGTLTACTAFSNGSHGFNAGLATWTGCTAGVNGGSGFAGTTATITGCTAEGNAAEGILVILRSLVRANTCYANGTGAGGGAGIHVSQTDNRIEGNNCTLNDRGIDVDATGNLIIANSCSGNTDPPAGDAPNYAIAGTQTIGPIINTAGTIASTNPWANFSY